MSVAPRTDSDDKEEWFSYSTGFYFRFGQPEIMNLGLDSDIGIRVLNEIGEQMKGSRRFDPGTDYSDVFADGVKCQFRPVHASQYEEYLCFSIWFYETKDFPAWQCFWPDEDGFCPWQEECSQDVRQLQPLLFKSRDESRQPR